MIGIFAPARHLPMLPEEQQPDLYKRLRWQIFAGIFFGYAGYYLVRKNFSFAVPYLVDMGFKKGDLGVAMSAVAIAYGLSKFLMALISDRSNPRIFMATGLMLSASVFLVMGFFPWATSSIAIMTILLFLNGWFQGMGWPPCGRVMVHWWSQRERGQIVSIWNTAHNVGGGMVGPLFILGMTLFADWRSAFYVPAIAALVVALFILLTVRDTPQSCGLPAIETFNNDIPETYSANAEKELTVKEIFMQYILPNRLLWYIACIRLPAALRRFRLGTDLSQGSKTLFCRPLIMELFLV